VRIRVRGYPTFRAITFRRLDKYCEQPSRTMGTRPRKSDLSRPFDAAFNVGARIHSWGVLPQLVQTYVTWGMLTTPCVTSEVTSYPADHHPFNHKKRVDGCLGRDKKKKKRIHIEAITYPDTNSRCTPPTSWRQLVMRNKNGIHIPNF